MDSSQCASRLENLVEWLINQLIRAREREETRRLGAVPLASAREKEKSSQFIGVRSHLPGSHREQRERERLGWPGVLFDRRGHSSHLKD